MFPSRHKQGYHDIWIHIKYYRYTNWVLALLVECSKHSFFLSETWVLIPPVTKAHMYNFKDHLICWETKCLSHVQNLQYMWKLFKPHLTQMSVFPTLHFSHDLFTCENSCETSNVSENHVWLVNISCSFQGGIQFFCVAILTIFIFRCVHTFFIRFFVVVVRVWYNSNRWAL